MPKLPAEVAIFLANEGAGTGISDREKSAEEGGVADIRASMGHRAPGAGAVEADGLLAVALRARADSLAGALAYAAARAG